ncbi:MAG: phosphate ABC transporter substrate-binding/OmpA family protein [Planctomycetota bacterium]|nr:phosphate ABC transporter substrate-binding/OmpA family protein [Planctomycetota bacterium]
MDGQDVEPGKPKPLFYVAVFVVVVGLILFAVYRSDIFAPAGRDQGKVPTLTKEEMEKLKPKAEAADSNAPTTAKEYKYIPSEKLPPVAGVAGYKALEDNTVKFALNVWAGWAPIIYANDGFKPKKEWTTAEGKKFKVELVLLDNPVAMRDAYASGNVHIGWATVDMLPLFMDELRKDKRTWPRVYQQIDWSNGGDGIVARDSTKSIASLRGKTVVLAENSPSQYFVLNALINGGVQPAEVNFKYTEDAFKAAAAFNADKAVTAAVSWAPDIYNISKVKGNKLLVSTQDANHLIADVWFARADFAKDCPDIIEGLVRGILTAVDELEAQEKKQAAAKLMAAGYSLPPDDAFNMLGDAHWTNYAENREFFMNENNPTNFQRTWDNAYYLYRRIGKITTEKVDFDQVMDFSVIQKLGKEEQFAKSVNKYITQFAPQSVAAVKAEKGEILTKTVVIHFFANSADIKHKLIRTVDGKSVEELYDPNADFVIDEIGKLAGQFGAARIIIEGHTDASMKSMGVPFSAVQQLSEQRANAVRQALLAKFPSLPPNQTGAAGMGWNVPANPAQPMDHAKNRRVEVKVYPLEAQ